MSHPSPAPTTAEAPLTETPAMEPPSTAEEESASSPAHDAQAHSATAAASSSSASAASSKKASKHKPAKTSPAMAVFDFLSQTQLTPAVRVLTDVYGAINDLGRDKLTDHLQRRSLSTVGELSVLRTRLKSVVNRHLVHLAELEKPNSPARTHKAVARLLKDKADNLDYLCVCDFEATCEEAVRDFPFEIIEFPVVLVNCRTLQIEDKFSAFVRPTINPILSKFCVELTGIQQDMVDAAEPFPVVLQRVNDWLEGHKMGTEHSYAFATDGPWDLRDFFTLSCAMHGITRPAWSTKWLDVRKLFDSMYGERLNLEGMLKKLSMEFEGRPHRGIDDTVNIARIAVQMLADGAVARTNDHLERYDISRLKTFSDHSLAIRENLQRPASS